MEHEEILNAGEQAKPLTDFLPQPQRWLAVRAPISPLAQ
jgi:hypothetical protein